MRVINGEMSNVFDKDGELSDEAARHIWATFQTRDAILKFVEPMAKLLAEIGRSSSKAMGDSRGYAVDRWSKVIRDRAMEILREDDNMKQTGAVGRLPAPGQAHANSEG